MTVKRVSKLDFDWDKIERVSPAEGSFAAMRDDIAKAKKRSGKARLRTRKPGRS